MPQTLPLMPYRPVNNSIVDRRSVSTCFPSHRIPKAQAPKPDFRGYDQAPQKAPAWGLMLSDAKATTALRDTSAISTSTRRA